MMKPDENRNIKQVVANWSQEAEDGFSICKRPNEHFHCLRFAVAIMCGLGLGFMCLLRHTFAVAVLNMVNQTHLYLEEHPERTLDDFLAEGYAPNEGIFQWNNKIQQTILSAYMISYTLPMTPLGQLARKWGPRRSLALGLSVCVLTTLVTPFVAHNFHWIWMVILRLIHGLGASPTVPILMNVIEAWAPTDDRSFCISLWHMTSAFLLGLDPILAGLLCRIHWHYAFYVPALIVASFVIIWLLLVSDHPRDNQWISGRELKHIYSRPGQAPSAPPVAQVSSLEIISHPDFYAILVVWCIQCSLINLLFFTLPIYLRQFLHADIGQVGFLCGLVISGEVLANLWPHHLICWLQRRFGLDETNSRRLTCIVASSFGALTYILVGLFHRYQTLLLFLNRSVCTANEFILYGSVIIIYGPLGASSLAFSLMSTVANLQTSPLSVLTGWALDATGQSVACWSAIFYVFAAGMLVVLLMFGLLVRTEPFIPKRLRKPPELVVTDAC